MTQRIGRWLTRRRGAGRRDMFVLRTESGWEVHGRLGGSGWPEVTHYFDSEEEALAMVRHASGEPPPGRAPVRPAFVAEPGLELR